MRHHVAVVYIILMGCSAATSLANDLVDAAKWASEELVTKAATAVYGAPVSIDMVDYAIVSGDVASGVVLKREYGSIAIDITPCILKDKKVKVFVKPFTETGISDAKCADGKSYPRIQIIQGAVTRTIHHGRADKDD